MSPGVTLPGTPFVIVGHNQHIAWGFTNLGADVQDLVIEQTRGAGSQPKSSSPPTGWVAPRPARLGDHPRQRPARHRPRRSLPRNITA